MHAMWKGTIQIAKFQIPIKLYAATEDKEISLKQTHTVCGGSISHLKFCQACGTKVESEEIRKGYDLGGGNLVELTEDELKGITPQASKSLLVEQFADEEEISRIRLKKHYYMGTDEVGEEAFKLFQASLVQAKKIGIGYITLRSVQSLAAVWPLGDGLVLSTMLYEDEIRAMEQIHAPSNRAGAHISEAHLFVFNQLIQAMSATFVGSKYVNRYDVALRSLIDNKITKLTPKDRIKDEPELQRNANLEDLLSSLNTSLNFVKNEDDVFTQSDFNQTH
ncbi:non-homologous end joining protein Ku [Cohnella mopanensis]|uniref:non-homologous end joining protein Ku n=1 Tax=Cohnella mopanensis TaxID=2911966 RepID=UPI001EF89C25|nr:Ku protein [Cohnella mopanensis]